MDASIYRMRPCDVLTVCVLALLALGVVMVQSASTTLNACITRAAGIDPAPNPDGGPAAPAGLMAVADARGIELSWTPDSDSAVVSYKVCRSDVPGGPFTPIQTVAKPTCSFVDAAAPAGSLSYYRLIAVDDVGRESAPAALSSTRPGNWRWTPIGVRHSLYAITALATFFAVGRVRYSRFAGNTQTIFRSPVVWALGIAGLLCVAVLVPGIGTSVNGARRWLRFGPVQLQPSELAKWTAVVFLAWWLNRPSVDVRRFVHGFLPTLAPIAALCLLVVIQDFGTAALIALCAVTMLLAGRVKLWHLLIVLLPAVLIGSWFVTHKAYRMRRIMAFRDPYASPQGDGYHMIQSLLSFSTGGIGGRGLGNGIQKLGYLPEDTTDFIFAVICEELGLFGAMLTVALYLGILYVAWQIVRQKRDDFGRLLAFGIGSMLGLQAAINIAVATVSVPTKGLSLPLISAGGTGLIITCGALGLLYSVTRFGQSPSIGDDARHLDTRRPAHTLFRRRAISSIGRAADS
jgi:cell division protein FtsW